MRLARRIYLFHHSSRKHLTYLARTADDLRKFQYCSILLFLFFSAGCTPRSEIPTHPLFDIDKRIHHKNRKGDGACDKQRFHQHLRGAFHAVNHIINRTINSHARNKRKDSAQQKQNDRRFERARTEIGEKIRNQRREKGCPRRGKPQGIGYKEMAQCVNGNISLEDAIYQIKLNTRHFAKRQLTWFRRERDVTMININEFAYNRQKVLDEMLMILEKRNIIRKED